jgi:DNA transposition AAA+ family ATPase
MGTRWLLATHARQHRTAGPLVDPRGPDAQARTDGIHFHTFRYLSLTLAAYVGEEVSIRFDPKDMGEIRVFYRDRFLCRAISADLAGQTVPLREIINASKRRREQLRAIVKDRLKTVDTLLEFTVSVETLEYKRFVEFCEACRRDRYIGLCYGPPGMGKTLSAIHHSRIEKIVPLDRWNAEASDTKPIDTVLFTPEVVNTPSRIENDVRNARALLCSVAKRATRAEQRTTLDILRSRDEAWRVEHREDRDYRPNYPLPLKPTYYDTLHEYESRLEEIADPTTLIVVDEADRLAMNSLEQLRSIFDHSGLGMVLIGMPGIEKRIARYPQLFSRIGFVHEFRALPDADIQALFDQRWTPVGIHLPASPPAPEVIAAVIRLTRGNFRLLVRLLTQMERVLAINGRESLSVDVVETARENLVIGQA